MTQTGDWRGDAHRVLPRFFERNLAAAAAARPAPIAAPAAPQPSQPDALLIGREGELRGIPVIARGVGGAVAGTDPFRAAVAAAKRRRELE